jgi:hypothetical protein
VFHSDKEAFLFNLTQQQHFPVLYHTHAVRCGRNKGPSFGDIELVAWHQPFNKDYACNSFVRRSGYTIPEISEDVNDLTQWYRADFTIDELEVWQVAPI